MLDSKATSINEMLPNPASYATIVAAIQEGFCQEYGIQFQKRSLSDPELNSIRLLQKKYEQNWR
jgi:lipoate-protein ligase A